jgi:hypothetical protein
MLLTCEHQACQVHAALSASVPISTPAVLHADQLSCLTATDVYRYMSQEHDATTMGLLLGMAAAKAGKLMPATPSCMLHQHHLGGQSRMLLGALAAA